MILLSPWIIVADAGFEPGTSGTKAHCAPSAGTAVRKSLRRGDNPARSAALYM